MESGYFNYKVRNTLEQKDYITGFAFEGEFVGDYPNCLSGQTSEVTIVADPNSGITTVVAIPTRCG